MPHKKGQQEVTTHKPTGLLLLTSLSKHQTSSTASFPEPIECTKFRTLSRYPDSPTTPDPTPAQRTRPHHNEAHKGPTIIEEISNGWDKERDGKQLPERSEDSRATPAHKVLSLCQCCKAVLRSHHHLPEHPTLAQRLKYYFTCPPHGKVGDCLMWLVIGFAIWGSLIALTGDSALPGGNLFSLVVLYVLAVVVGAAASLADLPPLLGSLLVGILYRSIPGINILARNIDRSWATALKTLPLIIILTRAGLGLDAVALKTLSFTVLRLSLLPVLVESATTSIASKFFLDLPWGWSLMLGFIVGAVSPAVVVPGLLKLSMEGYGVEKGIPTLVIAAASVDNVLAISGASIMLGVIFSEGSLVWTILKSPAQMFLGVIYGIACGLLCWILPYHEKMNRATYKFILVFCLGALGVLGSREVGLASAGPLSILTLAFVAGMGWRRPGCEDPEVSVYYRMVWNVFEPMLYALIGAEIDVASIDTGTVGWGLLTLLLGLTLRVTTSFLVVMGASFTIWERLFIAIAWLPKATVQAAIGSQALDYVREHQGDAVDVTRGQQVVTIAVLSILATAPIGAAIIKITGPRFLEKKIVVNPEANV
ncbi:sodium/hydrogen exchanger 9B2 [Procambarus clarkii]|uniref:sodium/hydrogen exchanger 9B2 n=1 Tax=Procambarus clarkii TaxID=6728 RepID=UPI001E6758C5|nr:sodium/hydrogen exchanger 9B2-like [Procambarus clarkii]